VAVDDRDNRHGAYSLDVHLPEAIESTLHLRNGVHVRAGRRDEVRIVQRLLQYAGKLVAVTADPLQDIRIQRQDGYLSEGGGEGESLVKS
jgi:hypothetical protein